MSDLYHLRVRQDATGPVARWAGERVTRQPIDYETAHRLREHMPNGRHIDIESTIDTKENDR